jgi:hypothetical protein
MSRITILFVVLIVAVVVPSLVASGVQAQPPPIITSVILTRVIPGNNGLVYITINGRNLGTGPVTDNHPQLVGYSGIDTEYGVGAPALGIRDVNLAWNAGGDTLPGYGFCGTFTIVDGQPFGGCDAIGVYVNAWTNTQIVLGGFGSGAFGYHIHAGDKLVFAVFTTTGTAYYVTYYNGPSV